MIRDLNRLSDGIDENNQNSARRRIGSLGRLGRSAARMIGPLNTALSVAEMLTPPKEEYFDTSASGWYLHTKCQTPAPNYTLGYGLITSSFHSVPNSTAISLVNACTAGQAFTLASQGDPWAYVLSNRNSVIIGRTVAVPGSFRAQCQQYYYRPVTGAFVKPVLVAAVAAAALPKIPDNLPSWPVTAFPDAFPPLAAPAFTGAIPWALLPSRADPAQEVVSNMRPSRGLNVWSVAISPKSAGSGSFSKPPRFHDAMAPNEGPKRPDKERKIRTGPTLTKFLRFLGTVTEAADTVDALYKALPSEYRPRYGNTKYEKRNVSHIEKLQALYDHWDKVSLDDAIINLVNESVQDRIWGELGKVGGDISRRLGHSYGTGVNSLQKRTHNLSRGFDLP